MVGNAFLVREGDGRQPWVDTDVGLAKKELVELGDGFAVGLCDE
jgi:hypothetical protein